MLIEQAIFTSAKTETRNGYQLVSVSPGIEQEDRRELSLWCPSHQGMLGTGPTAQSINFHRMTGGSYCVSRTTAAGTEYSERSGERVYTHCLLAPPDVLARFANNPFALANAAQCSGLLDVRSDPPRHLPAVPIVGRASAVSRPLLESLVSEIGVARLGTLIDAAVQQTTLGLVGEAVGPRLIQAVLTCLPLECRVEFSLSTGLKHSSRRPFRWLVLPSDENQLRRLERQHGVYAFDVRQPPENLRQGELSWGRFVARTLAGQGVDALSACLIRPRPGLTTNDLGELARELTAAATPSHPSLGDAANHDTSVDDTTTARPSEAWLDSPAAIDRLESLDDAVYESFGGEPAALEHLADVWPGVRDSLDDSIVEESRERYIDYAMRVWGKFHATLQDPTKAVAALDVLCILLSDSTRASRASE